MCNAVYLYYVPKITDACQHRFFIHWKFLSMLYDDHDWCIFLMVYHNATIDSIDLFVPYMCVARKCPVSHSVCANYAVTGLGGSASETIFVVSATCRMQTRPLGL